MKLYSLEETILKIAEAVPDIRTVHKGDVYYYNEQENIEYSAFNVLMREVFEYRSDYYTIFHTNLFAFDRLTESKDNLSDCESHAVQQLKAIIKKLEDLGATIDSVAYYPFTQRFNDLCAGAYADVRIRVETNDCGDYYFDIGDIIDLYDIYITKNGTYTAETGGAYKTVTVNVEGGGTDYNHYHEDVDESTNAQLNVNNNIIQVSRDGIEIYDKDNKGRINVDYDGVNVYGSALTFNDARVLTTNDLDDVNGDISEINEQINTINGEIENLNPLVLDDYLTAEQTEALICTIINAYDRPCPDPTWQVNTLLLPPPNNILPQIGRRTQRIRVENSQYSNGYEYGIVGVYYFKNNSSEPKGLRITLGGSGETYWYSGVVYWNDIEWDGIEADGDGWSGREEATHVFPPYYEGWVAIYGDEFEIENITVQQYNVVK